MVGGIYSSSDTVDSNKMVVNNTVANNALANHVLMHSLIISINTHYNTNITREEL